jgi:hypothetical protein
MPRRSDTRRKTTFKGQKNLHFEGGLKVKKNSERSNPNSKKPSQIEIKEVDEDQSYENESRRMSVKNSETALNT